MFDRRRPTLDARNCYPDDGWRGDRIGRALKQGFPTSIEQDLAWYRDQYEDLADLLRQHSALR